MAPCLRPLAHPPPCRGCPGGRTDPPVPQASARWAPAAGVARPNPSPLPCPHSKQKYVNKSQQPPWATLASAALSFPVLEAGGGGGRKGGASHACPMGSHRQPLPMR